jgi:ribosomal protein S8
MLEYPVSRKHKDKFEDILEQQDYMSDINLTNVSVDQAINGKVWTDIKESWTSDNRIPRCEQVCKENKRDKFIKEQL